MAKEQDVLYEIGETIFVRTLDNTSSMFGNGHTIDISISYLPGVVLAREFKLWQIKDQEPYWKYTVLVGDKKRVISELATRPTEVDTENL